VPPQAVDHPFAGLVIRSVLVCYAAWGSVVVFDLVACESKRPGNCEPQRAELRGAATAIPGTLLAWLADSPMTGSGRGTSGRTSSRTTPDPRKQS
jgi:hypothetical protein